MLRIKYHVLVLQFPDRFQSKLRPFQNLFLLFQLLQKPAGGRNVLQSLFTILVFLLIYFFYHFWVGLRLGGEEKVKLHNMFVCGALVVLSFNKCLLPWHTSTSNFSLVWLIGDAPCCQQLVASHYSFLESCTLELPSFLPLSLISPAQPLPACISFP